MLAWLSVNLVNIILIAVIVAVTALLIRSMIRDKIAGKTSCGGNCACCSACSACGRCHEGKQPTDKSVTVKHSG